MEVLTQQVNEGENLESVISSNLPSVEKESNVERLKNGLKSNNNSQISDTKRCIPSLNQEEKRELFEFTLKMGNYLYYNENPEVDYKEFKHNYSLRYIELDQRAIEYIEAYKNKTIIY